MDSKRSSPFSIQDLENFFLLSPDLLAVVCTDGTFRQVNSAFEQILGWDNSEILSSSFDSLLHKEDRPELERQLAKLMEQGHPTSFCRRCRCFDGRWKWIEWTICKSVDAENRSVFYCIGRDVSQRYQVKQDLALKQQSLASSKQKLKFSQENLESSKQELRLNRYDLQRSEQLFQAIFNQTFQFIGLLTPDGTLIEVNETALTFGGISAAQVLNKPFWETPWWQSSVEVKAQLRDAIAKAAQGEFIRYEVDVLGANNTVATIDFSLKPIQDELGHVILLIPEGRDITERRTIELELQRLNTELEGRVARRTADIQRYAEAIENMQDGFHLWHLEDLTNAASFRLELANPAAAQLLDMANEDVLGTLMGEAMPNLMDTEIPEICRQTVLTGHKKDLDDIPYVLANGTVRVFSVKFFPLEEQFLGVLFEDVTERRQEQQQHLEQKEQLRVIVEQAGVGIARLDIAGQWIQANDKLCEIFAYPREELFQKDFREITHPDDDAQDAEVYQALVSGQLETVNLEKRYVRKDGQPVWCSVNASIIRDHNQQPLYFIAFIANIQQRKADELALKQQKDELAMGNLILAQTTANLEQRNRDLDEFAYVASHDLKAPLRAIANLATWLEEDLEGQLPEENKEQLALLQGRVHRMENLIDGLLAYSRAGRGNHKAEDIDLDKLLQTTLDLLAPPSGFTIDIASNLPRLWAPRPAVTQIFHNLIGNAIKHHHRSDGRIAISYQLLDDGFHEFTVTDDGPGIDPSFHRKIFQIFQVLEARDKVENTGIGLAIVKRTIEAEGGTITLKSSPGQGAAFRFTWPTKGS
ncbi:MAG: PAS domain S-box protein [Cyanobacteria bacterium P01_D01_bin.56]